MLGPDSRQLNKGPHDDVADKVKKISVDELDNKHILGLFNCCLLTGV